MESTATTSGRPPQRPPRTKRQIAQARRRRNRLLPLLAVALASFIAGVVVASGSPDRDSATRFVRAWAKQDFAAMYKELNHSSAARYPLQQFSSAYLGAQQTATAIAINPGHVSGPTDVDGQQVVKVGMQFKTTLWGQISGEILLPYRDGGIQWSPNMTFPGLNPGEVLARNLDLSSRAPILAKNGEALATGQGANRSSPLGDAATDVVGELGHPDTDQIGDLEREGFPSDVDVGVSGLERAFNSRLAGTPGGRLMAVTGGQGGDVPASTQGRTLATSTPKPGQPLHTTIDPVLQQASVEALGDQIGGVAVLDARNGSVRALAGSAFSSPAPPGSTFKMITTVAALQQGVVKLNDQFAPVSGVDVGGREIANNNNEVCGGSFIDAFAQSCNAVFAPLGPKIGSDAMVGTAEKFGFNEQPQLFDKAATDALDPPRPSIPTSIPDDLDLGVTAIGQGQVLATPLEMASVAQTIGAGGMRSSTPMVTDPGLGPTAKPVRVTTPQIAGTLKDLMIDVVNFGTGTSASLGKIQVAGKTGTAELGPKPNQPPPKPVAPGEKAPAPKQIIDAWFSCFAPAKHPKLVVAVFLADASGDGGEVAAPIARDILETAFGG